MHGAKVKIYDILLCEIKEKEAELYHSNPHPPKKKLYQEITLHSISYSKTLRVSREHKTALYIFRGY
jgi:hypothetical protein